MRSTTLFAVLLGIAQAGFSQGYAADPAAGASHFQQEKRPHVAMIISEDEYGADKTLPAFAKMLSEHYGCYCTVAQDSGQAGIRGLDELEKADVAVLFVRRRALPKEQLQKIRRYLDAGGALVALRTASHAFDIKAKSPDGCDQWPEFDREVLGGNYHDHAQGTSEIAMAADAIGHPVLAGLEPAKWTSGGTLYFTSPIDKRATVLLTASAQGKTEPAAWTRQYKNGRVFYTSLGHKDDFAMPQFQRLLVNAIFWAMDRTPQPVPMYGKPVRIVSLPMYNQGLEKTLQAVDREGAAGADLILLTEIWRGEGTIDSLDAPSMTALAAMAKKHHTYIVSPIDRKDGDTVYNSSVLLNREGKVAGIYNKVYPVMSDPPGVGGEFKPGIHGKPGSDATVFETDFGRVGMAICFDAQFPEVWQRLEDRGAQLVLFSSAYSAGRSLEAYATLHHYYIVSSVWNGECQAYDITGEKLLDERKGASRITLDLDRRIFHNNDSYNYRGQRNKLLKENPGVVIDKWLIREDWHVLRAAQPGIDLPALVKIYDLQELRDYLAKQRREADRLRGQTFKTVN